MQRRKSIAVDVALAFRPLPMFALVAARYLSRIARVSIFGIYYGPGGRAPALRLDGLLHILDGVESLATCDKNGD
ncbi:MAG: hypothetical protein K6346_02920 [Halothiobacillaceae bacterium]